MSRLKTKQQKRELIATKIKLKKKLGATLASQIKHAQITKQHAGNKQ